MKFERSELGEMFSRLRTAVPEVALLRQESC